ncbi:hypothetical protein [Leifsonia sp. NPDC077715]|uniref:hypothetical protein n=1 Tax=Leifsonia sp. NPDC077715 TaxID=3155539 RepID=UPI003433EB8D
MRRRWIVVISIACLVALGLTWFVRGYRDFHTRFTEEEVVGTWVAERGQEMTFRPDGTAHIRRFEWHDSVVLDGPAKWSLGKVSEKPSVDGVAGVNGFHLAGARSLADGLRLVSYIGDPDDSRNIVWWTRR